MRPCRCAELVLKKGTSLQPRTVEYPTFFPKMELLGDNSYG
jgi:hypothetical protein